MKKSILILCVALVAGLASFCLIRCHRLGQHPSAQTTMLDAMPELLWLKSDLHLSESQFAKVSALHAAYRPQCAEMCHSIASAHEHLETVASNSSSVTPELQAAINEQARIEAQSRQAMLQHLYDTAAQLDPKQAARYLQTMLPYALEFTRGEAMDRHSH